MAKHQQIAAVLDKAADLLTPEGAWIQRDLNRGCSYCALGAIDEACDILFGMDLADGFDFGADEFLKDAAGTGNIARWNDAPSRTQEEVVSAFRKAAELARAKVPA